ncbi:MAG: phenylacetate--CoA ligase family protein [Actinomycetota bacterium]|nr:phenylacetate--CoA ligase family protein [Actinomycetota bacterium]
MDGERPYWNMEIEPILNTPEMREMQLAKLKALLRRLYEGAPFYRKQFDELGVVPEKIASMEDFSRAVPLFDKEGLRTMVLESGGDLLAVLDQIMPVSVDDLSIMATTTGTTGIPTPYPMSWHDMEDVWGEAMVRGMWRAGVRKQDRILFCFALSMVIAGVPTMMGAHRLGSMAIPVGAEAGTDRIMLMQTLFRGTVYSGTPSLADYLIEKCREQGRDPKDLGLRKLMCGGEPGAGIPEVRNRLESAFGARIFDAGAGFGFSCDHEEYQGMHWTADDLALYELVDPDTKESIPLEDGAEGEAIFTVLDGDGMSWLRTSLGDIQQVFTSPCPCGKTGIRYKVVGRTDDMLKVKGAIVYPTMVEGVVGGFVPRVTGQFRIVLTEKPPRVVPPLKIKIERAEDFPADKLPELEKEMKEAFHVKAKFTPEITWLEAGELERSTYKGQTFERLYEQ